MKKRNWLLTIAFAVLSLTVISTCVIGSTYAKYTSQISTNSGAQAAGFLVTGGNSVVETSDTLIAPGESATVEATVNYFSQVLTEISETSATISGTGIFDETAWAALVADYNAKYGASGSESVGEDLTHTALSDFITVSIGEGTGSGLAEQFVDAVIAAKGSSAVTKEGTNRLTAMGAAETTAITVTLEINVTWTDAVEGNEFDTFVGNAIAQNLTAAQYGATKGISTITVSLPLTATQVVTGA